MKYTLVVMTGPENGMGHDRARGFAQALAQQGHRLQRVFFYGDGVRAAQGETPQCQQFWTTLAESEGSELVLCSASAERAARDQGCHAQHDPDTHEECAQFEST